jgi:CheY-like chemotaxis protein
MAVNASDAMAEGGVLTLEMERVVLSQEEAVQVQRGVKEGARVHGGFVLLSVSDTGCGMSPEVQAHIFEPFFTTKGGGLKSTGLGLSTVYGIVEQHMGHIALYSRTGMGTTFRVYIPLIGEAAQEALEEEEERGAPSGTGTILVTEGDPLARALLVKMLQRLGYSILEAEDLRQAQTLAATYGGRIHLLIADLSLLEAENKGAVRDIKARHRNIKILPTSGFPKSHLVAQGAVKGDEAMICRPFQTGLVAHTVHAVMERSP